MNLNITIGQYYPASSKIHSLDPRTKLLALFVFIIILFSAPNAFGYVVSALGLFGVILMSKVPVKFMLKGLRNVFFIIIFTVVLNVFFVPGETVLFQLGFLRVTLEGLFAAARMACRLVLLIIASSVLTLTTSPIELTDGIEHALKPFKKIGVPAHEIAMMMTIALRFIPTLMEETDRIMKAQISRGADFGSGNLVQKAKAIIPLLVPLFISAFRRADELALAMESRCYRGDENRTRMKVLKRGRIDYIFYLSLILFGACVYFTRFLL
ncbi:MAG: energy-coupling factor transporter transmembrane protein EcfT [Defluviitaleaceae bacterium]|nr:energy-coupling factor transporter transmembrane protein EcfT [Defluviitaleaceae bacterium]